MKNNYSLFFVLLTGILSAQYDGFSSTGNLSSNGWDAHSSVGSGPVQILTTASDLGNSLKYNGITNPSGNRIELKSSQAEDLNKAFTTPISTTVFVSFFLKYTDVSNLAANSLTTAPTYFAHLSPVAGASIGTAWPARISVKQGSAANTFNLGILNTTGGTITASDIFGATPANYNINSTYFVVIKYDLTTASTSGTSSIWINPVIGTSAPAATVTSSIGTSSKPTSVAAFAVRQATSTSAVGSIGTLEMDEVRIGSTWQDVVIPQSLSTIDVAKKKILISNTLVKDNFRVLSSQKTNVEIYSTNGRFVKGLSVNSNEFVNVSDLSAGVYMVKIKEGNETNVVKIVKE